MIAALVLGLALAAEPAKVPPPPPKPVLQPQCPVEEKTVPTPPGFEPKFPTPPAEVPQAPSSRWRWTPADSVREVAVVGLLALDWHQTLRIGRDGREMNPILGPRPSPRQVTTYFALATAAQLGITIALPAPYRGQFQIGIGAMEATITWSNVKNGY